MAGKVSSPLAVALGRKKPRRTFDFFGAAGYGYDNAYVNGRKPSGMRNVRPTAGAHRNV